MQIENNKKLNVFFNDKLKNVITKKDETTEIKKQDSVKDEYRLNITNEFINEMKNKMKEGQEIRVDKVEEVKRQVESGEYKVTGKDVVLKLLGEKMSGTRHY